MKQLLVQTRVEQVDHLHLCRCARYDGISVAAYLRRLIMADRRGKKTTRRAKS